VAQEGLLGGFLSFLGKRGREALLGRWERGISSIRGKKGGRRSSLDLEEEKGRKRAALDSPATREATPSELKKDPFSFCGEEKSSFGSCRARYRRSSTFGKGGADALYSPKRRGKIALWREGRGGQKIGAYRSKGETQVLLSHIVRGKKRKGRRRWGSIYRQEIW